MHTGSYRVPPQAAAAVQDGYHSINSGHYGASIARRKPFTRTPDTTQGITASDLAWILDPFEFISRLMIVNKRGRLVRLLLNGEQLRIIEALYAGDDTLVLKPRQIGSSTAVAAYFFWQVYTSCDPVHHVVLSHKLDSAKHLFKIMVQFNASLPAALQRDLSVTNTTTMEYADSHASIEAMSASAEGGLRSFSATSIHISEFAFAANASELKATALSALNGGQLCIESTASHFGDPIHTEIGLSDSGEVAWNFLFFPWSEHDEYSEEPPPAFAVDESSDLTPGQQYWAHKLRGKLGESKFMREYPLTMQEAYAQLDGAWMADSQMSTLTVLRMQPEGGMFGVKVDPTDKYGIGVDAGAGTGGDYSVLAVVSARTGQIVEMRRSNQLPPTAWAEQVADASNKWNKAKVLTESNGVWGGIIVTELKHMKIPLWLDSDGNHWTTDGRSKPKMLEHLKDAIVSGRLQQVDDRTHAELRSFQIDERGMPYCPRGGGHHGDSVIALALALQCIQTVHLDNRPMLPQWIRDQKTRTAQQAGAHLNLRRY